jgi:glutathione S-transferase
MQLILYYAPNACSLVPYVTLTEAGAPFEVHPLNFRKSQHMAPEYLRLNPKHKVPVLVIDGAPLTENVAIQIWIARHFPAARLLPSDPMQELHAISLLAWCASGIHPFLSRINSPPRVCDLPGAEASVRRLAQQQLFENYQIADDKLAGREWFFDHFTAVDAHFLLVFSTRHPIQSRSFPIQELHRAFRADAAAAQRAKIARLRTRGADRLRPGGLITFRAARRSGPSPTRRRPPRP